MARIVGVDLPKNKRGEVALTYIFGVGQSTAKKVLSTANVSLDAKVKDWNDDDINNSRKVLSENYKL